MRLIHPDSELRPDRTQRGSKRVLLIAYHFPPSTAIGALRWDRLARHLVSVGYAVDVITLEPAQTPRTDARRLVALPSGITVFGVQARAPMALVAWNWLAQRTKSLRTSTSSINGGRPSSSSASANPNNEGTVESKPRNSSISRRLRMMINARLHVLEELQWARAAAQAGRDLGREKTYEAVITSGPPHYSHHAGYVVGRDLGIPHIPDFRDPWRLAESISPDHDLSYLKRSDEKYESRIVENAAAVIMNTEAAAVAMRQLYPARRDKILAIMNGSDPEDRVSSPRRDRFTLLYAGSLYLQRDPRVLFRACSGLVRELGLTPEQFAIQFLGPVDVYAGKSIPELAAPYGLREHVIVSGLVPRSAALAASASATQLVCLPDGQRLTIPAKLFEYVQLDTWLLAFADPESAMSMALEGLDADVVAPGDVLAAERAIRARWEQFASGKRPAAVDTQGRLGRFEQAQKLIEVLRTLPHLAVTDGHQRRAARAD